jgi:hypothetical protein
VRAACLKCYEALIKLSEASLEDILSSKKFKRDPEKKSTVGLIVEEESLRIRVY